MATINAINNVSAPFGCTGDLTITTGNLKLPTSSTTVGQIRVNNVIFFHNIGTRNLSLGSLAGQVANMASVVDCTNIGFNAGYSQNGSAPSNVNIGAYAGYSNTSGGWNTCVGYKSHYSNSSQSGNTAIGYQALTAISGGVYNTALGFNAGMSITTGYTSNIMINADGVAADNNCLRIGNGLGTGDRQLNKVYIHGIYTTAATPSGTAKITLTDSNALQYGLAGTAGQVLQGGTAPAFSTATYPSTAAIGDVLVASATNVIGVVAGAATSGYVLTANGAGTAPTFQAAAGGGIGTLAGDSGTATGATVTIAGGTNLTSSATSATVTINLDAAITGTTSLTGANGCEIRTGTTAADTLLISAYDVDGTAYVPFITLTANNTPTMDITSATTIGSAYIYRAGGTDVAVADGGTGASTLTVHGLLIGNSTSAINATTAGTAGQIIVSAGASADPTWTTFTIPGTVAKGDILVATDTNVVTAVAGATTSGYVLTANGAGTSPTFQANAGGGIGTLAGDSGTATGATVTIAGGAGCTSAAATATVTINVDKAQSAMTSVDFANAGRIGTGTTAADTLLLQAYDVDGTTYTTFATLTANNTPTMDLASGVTIGSAYIYRASGTDVAVADGGTGASTLTANGVLYGNGTSAVAATAEGGTGTVLIGTTSAAPSWLAAGTDGKVLTAHTSAAPTWETPGGGGMTFSEITADQTLAINTGYITNKAGTVLVGTLPSTAAVGSIISIIGKGATGWKIAQPASVLVHLQSSTTTTGVTGYLQFNNQYDCIDLICIVADLEWVAKTGSNITVA